MQLLQHSSNGRKPDDLTAATQCGCFGSAAVGAVSAADAKQAPDIAFQRHVGKLHDLGPYALLHFLREIVDGASVADRLPVYAGIDPDILRALGGDKLPSPPILCLDGGRA
jgi:hypothetical protein